MLDQMTMTERSWVLSVISKECTLIHLEQLYQKIYLINTLFLLLSQWKAKEMIIMVMAMMILEQRIMLSLMEFK